PASSTPTNPSVRCNPPNSSRTASSGSTAPSPSRSPPRSRTSSSPNLRSDSTTFQKPSQKLNKLNCSLPAKSNPNSHSATPWSLQAVPMKPEPPITAQVKKSI